MSYISDIRKKVGHDPVFMPFSCGVIIKDNNIKFLLDLHWCDLDRSFAIELWTWWETHPNLMWNQKLLNLIKDSLNKS